MLVKRGYMFILDLTVPQREQIARIASSLRFVWNCALEQRELYWQRKAFISVNEQDKQIRLRELKDDECLSFLSEIPKHCLQQKLADLEVAFERLRKGLGGYPSRKFKKDKSDSMRFPDSKQFTVEQTKKVHVRVSKEGHLKEIAKGHGIVDLPKLGKLKFRQSRLMKGEIRNVTILQKGNEWHVSFIVEEEINLERAENHDLTGVDLNANREATIALSNGELISAPVEKIMELEDEISYLKKKVARKKKGSSNQNKAYAQIAKLEKRKTNIVSSWRHEETTKIAKNHGALAVEKLLLKNMTKSAKGTKDKPGKNVKSKSRLNRSVLRIGFGAIRTQLIYKVAWRGGVVYGVNPAYTSKTCSSCGNKDGNIRDGRVFTCTSCGVELDADLNGSMNVRNKAESWLREEARGRDTSSSSVEVLTNAEPKKKLGKLGRRSRNRKPQAA